MSILDEAIAKLNPQGATFREQVQALSDEEWKALIRHSVKHPVIGGVVFPEMPSDEEQVRTVGNAGEKALREAFLFFDFAKWGIKELGIRPCGGCRLLDFGVGFGRMYRMFLKDFTAGHVVGSDVNQKYIDICRKTIPQGAFVKNAIRPPLEFPDGHFGVVTAYSVFSHLSEDLALQWFREFERILRPGGMALITVRTWNFIRKTLSGRDQPEDPSDPLIAYKKRLASLYSDVDLEWERHIRGEFIYPNDVSSVSSDDAADYFPGYYNSRHYSEAVVSLKWLMRSVDGFEVIAYADLPRVLPQALVLLRKRTSPAVDRKAYENNITLYVNTHTGLPDVCLAALAPERTPDERLEAILNSTSWKITAPLRWLIDHARRR